MCEPRWRRSVRRKFSRSVGTIGALSTVALVAFGGPSTAATPSDAAPAAVARAGATSYGLWREGVVPRTAAAADTSRVKVGVQFTTSRAGTIRAIQFYRARANAGPHKGELWTAGGRLLASVAFPSTRSKGWLTARLSKPVAVSPGVAYVASYVAPKGRYAADYRALSAAKPRVSGALTASRGVFTYGTGVPNESYRDTNYYVDVVFAPGKAPTSTPAPKPGPTPTPTPPTTTTTSSYSCVRAGLQDHCDFGQVPYIKDPNMSGDPFINQNIWSGDGSYKQKLYAASPRDWYITANANTGWGGVLTYPNIGWFTNPGRVRDMPETTSSWDVEIPHKSNVAGWAGYDLWFNNWADEVMIQPDFQAPWWYGCENKATATFGGKPWFMCQFGAQRVWAPGTDAAHRANQPRGSINVKEILTWMMDNGHLPASSIWTAASFGFEVCETSGAEETFRVRDFSWVAR